ncbi:MAG: hypothetical protein GY944_14135, partial [bacterium]|nr:hypothetical protein [bacterium]
MQTTDPLALPFASLNTAPAISRGAIQGIARRHGPIRAAEPLDIAIPNPRSATFALRYYAKVAQSMLGPHRLRLPKSPLWYRGAIDLSEADGQRWREAFDATTSPSRDTPFLQFQTVGGAPMLMRAVRELGLNFRHIRHVDSQFALVSPEKFDVSQVRTMISRIEPVVPGDADCVALVMKSTVHDAKGELVAKLSASFAVLNLPPEDVDRARLVQGGPRPEDESPGLSRRRNRRLKRDFRTEQINVPADMGVVYGRVSGDPNAMHTTRMGARLFGHQKPFLQG